MRVRLNKKMDTTLVSKMVPHPRYPFCQACLEMDFELCTIKDTIVPADNNFDSFLTNVLCIDATLQERLWCEECSFRIMFFYEFFNLLHRTKYILQQNYPLKIKNQAYSSLRGKRWTTTQKQKYIRMSNEMKTKTDAGRAYFLRQLWSVKTTELIPPATLMRSPAQTTPPNLSWLPLPTQQPANYGQNIRQLPTQPAQIPAAAPMRVLLPVNNNSSNINNNNNSLNANNNSNLNTTNNYLSNNNSLIGSNNNVSNVVNVELMSNENNFNSTREVIATPNIAQTLRNFRGTHATINQFANNYALRNVVQQKETSRDRSPQYDHNRIEHNVGKRNSPTVSLSQATSYFCPQLNYQRTNVSTSSNNPATVDSTATVNFNKMPLRQNSSYSNINPQMSNNRYAGSATNSTSNPAPSTMNPLNLSHDNGNLQNLLQPNGQNVPRYEPQRFNQITTSNRSGNNPETNYGTRMSEQRNNPPVSASSSQTISSSTATSAAKCPTSVAGMPTLNLTVDQKAELFNYMRSTSFFEKFGTNSALIPDGPNHSVGPSVAHRQAAIGVAKQITANNQTQNIDRLPNDRVPPLPVAYQQMSSQQSSKLPPPPPSRTISNTGVIVSPTNNSHPRTPTIAATSSRADDTAAMYANIPATIIALSENQEQLQSEATWAYSRNSLSANNQLYITAITNTDEQDSYANENLGVQNSSDIKSSDIEITEMDSSDDNIVDIENVTFENGKVEDEIDEDTESEINKDENTILNSTMLKRLLNQSYDEDSVLQTETEELDKTEPTAVEEQYCDEATEVDKYVAEEDDNSGSNFNESEAQEVPIADAQLDNSDECENATEVTNCPAEKEDNAAINSANENCGEMYFSASPSPTLPTRFMLDFLINSVGTNYTNNEKAAENSEASEISETINSTEEPLPTEDVDTSVAQIVEVTETVMYENDETDEEDSEDTSVLVIDESVQLPAEENDEIPSEDNDESTSCSKEVVGEETENEPQFQQNVHVPSPAREETEMPMNVPEPHPMVSIPIQRTLSLNLDSETVLNTFENDHLKSGTGKDEVITVEETEELQSSNLKIVLIDELEDCIQEYQQKYLNKRRHESGVADDAVNCNCSEPPCKKSHSFFDDSFGNVDLMQNRDWKNIGAENPSDSHDLITVSPVSFDGNCPMNCPMRESTREEVISCKRPEDNQEICISSTVLTPPIDCDDESISSLTAEDQTRTSAFDLKFNSARDKTSSFDPNEIIEID